MWFWIEGKCFTWFRSHSDDMHSQERGLGHNDRMFACLKEEQLLVYS